MRPSRGVTLTELLTAIAVLALLAAIGIPGLADLIDRQRLRAVADDLHGALHLARLEAIRRAAPVSVAFAGTSTPQWCYAVSMEVPCDCAATDCAPPGPVPRATRGAEFSGVALGTNFAPVEAVTFHPAHGTATAGTARLANGAGEVRLIVSTLGRIRACSDALPDYPPC